MLKYIFRFLNRLISIMVAVALATAALYAGYALWDNGQIYSVAESSFDEMRAIWAQAEKNGSMADSFADLRQINPDVTAWISVPGTAIEYPVLQGKSNMSYINTDVYGNFALSGSIFLDSRNAGDYSDQYSLLYGHNMSRHRMFSDINLFKDKEFFKEHTEAMLYLPDGGFFLTSVCVVVTPASNGYLFNPENWEGITPQKILQAVREDAMFVNDEGMDLLKKMLDAEEFPKLVCLSTCSSEFTDARTALIMIVNPEK